MNRTIFHVFGSLLLWLLVALCGLQAQELETPPKIRNKAQLKADRLVEVIETLQSLDIERNKILRSQRMATSPQEKELLGTEADRLQDDISSLQASFEEIVSNVNTDAISVEFSAQDLQLEKELKSLLAPILVELKKLTARPREIEKLNSDVFELSQKLELSSQALRNIDLLLESTTHKEVVKRVKGVREKWKDEQQAVKTQLEVTKQKLEQRKQNEVPISDSVRQLMSLFFANRGRNLGIALIVGLLIWLFSSRLYQWVARHPYLSGKREKVPVRLLGILAYSLTIVGSTVAFLISLYVVGDWILLLLSSTLILAAAWTSKHAISQFWSTIVLLLNMGPVRENEIVTINGVMWLVERLNVYSQLSNPLLSGGKLRISAPELQSLRSRKLEESEHWFPTKTGDWILIREEEVYGQVTLQSPEQVFVKLPGGSTRRYQTSHFLNLTPEVLSDGFRIKSVFGVDYAHQRVLGTEIVPTMKSFIYKALEDKGYSKLLHSLDVEINEAAASSLNLAILANFSGEAAHSWDILKRLLQRLAIEACTQHEWNIPFTQITLHSSK